MRVRFRTRRLQRQAESESLARRGYGPVVGRRFIQRVDALEEASAFESLFRCGPLICIACAAIAPVPTRCG